MSELFKAMAELMKLIRISSCDAKRAARTLRMLALTSLFIVAIVTWIALVARFIWPQ